MSWEAITNAYTGEKMRFVFKGTQIRPIEKCIDDCEAPKESPPKSIGTTAPPYLNERLLLHVYPGKGLDVKTKTSPTLMSFWYHIPWAREMNNFCLSPMGSGHIWSFLLAKTAIFVHFASKIARFGPFPTQFLPWEMRHIWHFI